MPTDRRRTAITGDFRALLDERFGRVEDKLNTIQRDLTQQNIDREERFKAIEEKVDSTDRAMRIVSGVSAGAGSVLGVAAHWVWTKLHGG